MGLFCTCRHVPPVEPEYYGTMLDTPIEQAAFTGILIMFAIMFIVAVWNLD